MADGVQVEDGQIGVDLPYASLAILATGRRDRIFYRLSAPDGRLVTGYDGLAQDVTAPPPPGPRFVDTSFLGTAVRAVVLGRRVADPGGRMVTLVVAHSRDERRALASAIFANAFLPVLLVALAAAGLIWFAVRQALAPLATIERLLRDRGPEELEPIVAPAPAEVRQLLGSLNRFMARLKANLALTQSFLADAAHQIRTPLATLRAQADLALEEEDAASLRPFIGKIHRHAVVVSQVTNQLLSHTMVAHRGQIARREPVDLVALIAQVARRAEAGGGPPIELGPRQAQGPVTVDGDPITLIEALTNLIENAGRYAGRDRPVAIRVAAEGRQVVVEVADRGPGIPDSEKPKVLERFVRGSGTRDVVGSGLGLAIVKAVVGSHDGSLALLDRPGGGLVVRMVFPGRAGNGSRPAGLATALVAAASLIQPAAAASATIYPAIDGEASRLVISAATDRPLMEPLLLDFQQAHPHVAIDYADVQSGEVYASVVSPAGGVAPDLAISSAMDLQAKLVNDGWTQPHVSPETLLLPAWANWRDEAFGFTLEPAVVVYARGGLAPSEVPRSRPELLRLLQQQPDRFRHRIATYDIALSGLGYLFASQDSVLASQFWPLTLGLGNTAARLMPTSAEILDSIIGGQVLLGYNVLGSYALARQQAGAPIGIVLPRDYTLWLARVAVIPRAARDPTTAKLFLDHLLSPRGQRAVGSVPGMRPIRELVDDPGALMIEGGASPQPITLGPALLVFLDQLKRERFLADWSAAMRAP